MWTVLTYAYNSILIIFIASHLLVGAIISFICGLYLGVYITQNYEIPRITEPSKLWDKLIGFMEQRRLRRESNSSLLRPKNLMSIIKAENTENISLDNQTRDAKTDATTTTTNDGIIRFDPDSPEEMFATGRQTPSLIFTEVVGEEMTIRRSPSQILAASLIIATDDKIDSVSAKKLN